MRIVIFSQKVFWLLAFFIFSLALSAETPKFLAVNSADTLYLSSDSGLNWEKFGILKDLNNSVYLTAASRNQLEPEMIAVGTSFEGIYESLDSGKTWNKLAALKLFKPYHQGSGFYEEVIGLAYATDGSNDLFFKLGYNGQSFRFLRAKKTAIEVDPNSPLLSWLPSAFRFNINLQDTVPVYTSSLPPPEIGLPLPPDLVNSQIAVNSNDPNKEQRRILASNKRGLYLNPNQASGNNLIRQLDFVISNKLNSIVVDFKDDQGMVTYDSQVLAAKAANAVHKRINAAILVKEAHTRGIYVIARIVVFKDKQLARFQKGIYSIWDKHTNKPWGVFKQSTVTPVKAGEPETTQWNQTEYWVDPYSDFVHQYNIDLAKEAQDLGVDEIQFDYIRFPSDGNTASLYCRFHKDEKGNIVTDESNGKIRVQALSTFLRKARENLTIPIGTDVFGFNGWARMSYLGQDIQAFSYYVDVISPMMYPSHYARGFLGWMKYFDRASYLYEVGTERARVITNNRSLIRPYAQAFLLGGETKWESPQYYDYLNRQVKSAYRGGASGFTLWNNMGRYYMVDSKNFSGLFPN